MAAAQRAALPAAVPAPRELAAMLGHVERRLRLVRALESAAILTLPALGAVALGLALLRTQANADARACFELAAALPWLGLLLGAARPVHPLLAARMLDRALGTPDLIASAWSFARRPEPERSAFMQACVRTASRRVQDVSAAQAVPITPPRALPQVAVLGCGVLLFSLLRVAPAVVPPEVVRLKPRLLQQDDIEAAHQAIAPLLAPQQVDPELRDAAQQLNALLEALRDERLERAGALAELRGLEQRLADAQSVEDEQAVREALKRIGVALERDSLTQSVADAFREGDAAKAQAALQRLARTLEPLADKPAARREVARSLARAGQGSSRSQQERVERAKRELDRLLHKRSTGGQDAEQQQRLLKQKERELDRLKREQERDERAERKLDGLRRELGSASQALDQGRGSDAREHGERGAQQLDQAQREQSSAEQRRRLAQRVQELRELISKQRAGRNGAPRADKDGAARKLSVDAFARAARGEDADHPDDDARGSKKPGSELLTPGDGQEPTGALLLPGTQSSEAGAADRDSSEREASPGSGGHPGREARATPAPADHVDTRVRGVEGEGPTRSQVIREAGQHGFVSRDYQRVHAEYERHAEAVLDHDKVPGGYRFYVRRYFQLIRPRETSHE